MDSFNLSCSGSQLCQPSTKELHFHVLYGCNKLNSLSHCSSPRVLAIDHKNINQSRLTSPPLPQSSPSLPFTQLPIPPPCQQWRTTPSNTPTATRNSSANGHHRQIVTPAQPPPQTQTQSSPPESGPCWRMKRRMGSRLASFRGRKRMGLLMFTS